MVRGIHKIPLPKIHFTIYKSINLMYNKRRGKYTSSFFNLKMRAGHSDNDFQYHLKLFKKFILLFTFKRL